MNQLTKFLVDSILNEGEDSLGGVALFGGGFKPPTKGHLEVILQGLEENPEIKQVYILVGSGERNGVTQTESVKIWEMYKRFIPVSTQIIKVQSPFSYIKTYLQDHQDEDVYVFIGARLGSEEDDKDAIERSAYAKKYSERVIPLKITTTGGVSGTKARQAALSGNTEEFLQYFPSQLTDSEKEEITQMITGIIKEIKLPNLKTLKSKFKTFLDKVKQEGRETKDAFNLLSQAAQGKKELTSSDKQQIKEQLQDILKSVFGAAVFALPAGTLVILLLKLFKLEGIITPSSFSKPTPVQSEAIVGKKIECDNCDWSWNIKDGGDDLFICHKCWHDNTPMLNENASYSKDIDIIKKCAELTNYMREKGYNIDPVPSVEFVNGDTDNARDFFGKTAYYDPNNKTIVLYTEGRHPKDIVRSYAHEMIHHIQNLEGRLGNITTTNTQEDGELNKIEAEANLKGTMTFRNWTDSILNENVSASSFPNSALLFGGFFTGIQRMGIGKTIISDLFKSNPKLDNLLLYTQDDAVGFWKKLGGKIIQQGEDKKGILRYFVQINRNDVDPNLNLKQLGISYKNLSTKKSKIDKGEYAIKMGKQKIGFFFVRDIGTIQMDPMSIFADNLNESTVDSKLYPFKIKDKTYDENDNSLITVEYNFTTPSNTYRVEFYSGEYNPEAKTFDLSFGVDRGELNTIDTFQMTGEGNARKVFNTVLNIVEDFIDKEDVKKIVVDGTDEKRKRIYKTLFSSTPPKISDKIELNEAIVGEKIECDNCDWSWKIVDGGDDLFMCHKCGHDNTPINEESKPYKHKHGFDDKLGKDPFGLNAYALELIGGLEEEILTPSEDKPKLPVDERLEYYKNYYVNVSPSTFDITTEGENIIIGGISISYPDKFDKQDIRQTPVNENAPEAKLDGKSAPYGSGYEPLNEGRYDKITNQVSREVFTNFKEIYDSGAKEGTFEFSVGPDDEDIFSEDLEFNLEGYIEVSDEMYQPDGGANAGYDDDGEEITPLIQVSFKIPQDPKEFKWSEVSFDIKDIIRHEIEHLTQDGENLKSGKYLEDDQLIRKLINAKMLPKSQYFKLEKEVDAMLQGLYFRAKKSRTPFKEVILNYFKKVGLTKEEQKQILDVWRSRRKALALPTFENTSN